MHADTLKDSANEKVLSVALTEVRRLREQVASIKAGHELKSLRLRIVPKAEQILQKESNFENANVPCIQ